MDEVVIVSGVRTAIGRFGGGFVETAARDLGAEAIREAVARAGIEPAQVDQVVLGCAGQFGAGRVSVADGGDGRGGCRRRCRPTR